VKQYSKEYVMRVSTLITVLASMRLVACGGSGSETVDGGPEIAADAAEAGMAWDDGGMATPDAASLDAMPASDAGPAPVMCTPGLAVGAKRCDGTEIETCGTDGEWGKAKSCAINNICVKNGKYGSCQPGCTSGNILCCPSGVTCYCQSEATVCPS
jgi:hypothetical protein